MAKVVGVSPCISVTVTKFGSQAQRQAVTLASCEMMLFAAENRNGTPYLFMHTLRIIYYSVSYGWRKYNTN